MYYIYRTEEKLHHEKEKEAGMRKSLITILSVVIASFAASVTFAVPLQQAYDEALPGAGYDRLVFLNPNETYTGGLVVADEDVCIISCGATIDLEGGVLFVQPDASLDICGVAIINANAYGLQYSGAGHGWIDHCTFYHNYDAVYFWEGSDMMLTSNIFSYSSHYGVYCHEDYIERWMAYNDAWLNTGGNYKEYCPG